MKILLSLFLFALLYPAYSALVVEGNYYAKKACPAYVSKNKKTNPGNKSLVIGQQYALVEINKSTSPDWFRVELNPESSDLRWVAAECGDADYTADGGERCDLTPGIIDNYALALSWQPGFCQTYGYGKKKPECMQLSQQDYQSHHFSLHGLWPNQKACGYHYGFCTANPQKHHCDYPELNLSPNISDHLQRLMPSYAYHSCLERHEWNKHGSCQLLIANDYFEQAMRLVDQFNDLPSTEFIEQHRGESVTLADLNRVFEKSLGKDIGDKVYLGCSQGVLVDVYLSLPAQFDATQSLSNLLAQAPKLSNRSTCGDTVLISDFISANKSK